MRTILAGTFALAACITAACGDVRTPTQQSGQEPAVAFASVDQKTAFASRRRSRDCSIDLVDGKPAGDRIVLRAGSTARIEGWAADGETNSVPAQAAILLRSTERSYYAYALRGLHRDDVAKASGIAAFATSGYVVSAGTDAVRPGDYSARLIQQTRSGRIECDTGKTIEVTAR